jgi:hypothetical protein
LTPYEQAALRHLRDSPEVPFRVVIEGHLFNGGHLLAGPDFFLLGRPVMSTWSEDQILEFNASAPRESADCWHVWLAAGDVPGMLGAIPYSLPFVSFHRHGRLKVMRLNDVIGKVRRLL